MIEIQERGVRIRKLIVLFHSYGGGNALKMLKTHGMSVARSYCKRQQNSVETNK